MCYRLLEGRVETCAYFICTLFSVTCLLFLKALKNACMINEGTIHGKIVCDLCSQYKIYINGCQLIFVIR